MSYQQQIIDNAAAIQALITQARQIPDLDALVDNVDGVDVIAIFSQSENKTVHISVDSFLSNSGQFVWDGVEATQVDIENKDPQTFGGQTWWAFDTKSALSAVFSTVNGEWYWQDLTPKYDNETDTYFFPKTKDGQMQNIGQETFFLAINDNGSTATELMPQVFLSLGASDAPNQSHDSCIKAVSSDISDGSKYGINTTTATVNGRFKCTQLGRINNCDTSPWVNKTILYVDPINKGTLTDIRPEINARPVAQVLYSHATQGILYVNTITNTKIDKDISIYTVDKYFLTGQEVTTPAGTFYEVLADDKGSVAEATESVSVPDNAIVGLSQDHLFSVLPAQATIPSGLYNATISFSQDISQANEKLYLELYLADDEGNVLDSGIAGIPNGSLGVRPIMFLASPTLNIPAGDLTDASLSGILNDPYVTPANHRFRYHIAFEKQGSSGPNKVFTAYFGSDHNSKVDSIQKITTDNVENVSSAFGDTQTEVNNDLNIRIDTKVQWRGNWLQTGYEKNDMVKDGAYTSIANKYTEDRAAPQEEGDEHYTFEGTLVNTQSTAKQVINGIRVSAQNDGFLKGYRIDVIAGERYQVYSVLDPLGVKQVTELASFEADTTGWKSLGLSPVLVNSGTVFDIVVIISEPDASLSTWVGDWNYLIPTNEATPAAGQMIHANKGSDTIRVSKTDNNSGDRSAELLALTNGDIIEGAGVRWVIQSVSDDGTYVTFGVSPQTQGTPGVNTFSFETVAATPLSYGVDTDYWLGNPAAEGLFIADGSYDDIVPNDNAYGVDLLIQDAYISPDWDVVAISGESGGAGGTPSGLQNVVEDTSPELGGDLDGLGHNITNVDEVWGGAFTGDSFTVRGGTMAQFLKANGTLDSNRYALYSELTAYDLQAVTDAGATTNNPIAIEFSSDPNLRTDMAGSSVMVRDLTNSNHSILGNWYLTLKRGTSINNIYADPSVNGTLSLILPSQNGTFALTSDIPAPEDWLRADVADVKTSGSLTFNNDISLKLGTSQGMTIISSGTSNRINLTGGSLVIQDNNTTRYTFSQAGDLTLSTGNVVANTAPTIGSHLTNKTYVDGEIAGIPLGDYVQKSGDTMTGELEFLDTIPATFGTNRNLSIVGDSNGVARFNLRTGNLQIQDNAVTKFLFGRTSGILQQTHDGIVKYEMIRTGSSPSNMSIENRGNQMEFRQNSGTTLSGFAWYNQTVEDMSLGAGGNLKLHADGANLKGKDVDLIGQETGSTTNIHIGNYTGGVGEISLRGSVVPKFFNGTTYDIAIMNSYANTSNFVTSGTMTAGSGSGGVSLTVNDGYGNANVTFNHKSGIPEQTGNAGRIQVNTDATTLGSMTFGVGTNKTVGVASDVTDQFAIYTGHANVYNKLRIGGSSTGAPTYTLSVLGDVYFEGSLYGDSKEVVRTSDTFLRLNPAGNFTSGIYVASTSPIVRFDTILQTGGGSTVGLYARYSDDTFNWMGSPILTTANYDGIIGGDYVAKVGDTMTGNLRLNDSVRLRLGTTNNIDLWHNGSNTYLDLGAGSFYVRDSANSSMAFFDGSNKNFTSYGDIYTQGGQVIASSSSVDVSLDVNKGVSIDTGNATGGWARGLRADVGSTVNGGIGFLGGAGGTVTHISLAANPTGNWYDANEGATITNNTFLWLGSQVLTEANFDGSPYVQKSGDTMTGNLVVNTGSTRLQTKLTSTNVLGPELALDSNDTGGNEWRLISAASGNAINAGVGSFSLYDNNAAKHRFVIKAGGNIGIGDNVNADTNLHVAGNTGFKLSNAAETINNIFYSGVDGLEIQAGNGDAIMGFDNSTLRVGVGTTSPDTKFEVSDTTSLAIRVSNTKAGTWAINEELASLEFHGSDSSGGGVGVKGAIRMLAPQTQGHAFDMAFSTSSSTVNDTEHMRLTQQGRLGLGTEGPSHQLHGTGDFRFEGFGVFGSRVQAHKLEVTETATNASSSYGAFRFGATSNYGSSKNIFYHRQDVNQIVVNEDGADLDFRIEGVGSTELFVTDAGNARVGIGTGSPATRLSSASTAISDGSQSVGSNGFNWSGANANAYMGAIHNTSTGNGLLVKVGDSNLNRKVIYAQDGSSNPLFLVRGDGTVGINVANPNATLDVDGTVKITGDVTIGDGLFFDESEGIYFENKKHAITWNDGTGNFNIRVGATDQSSTEKFTEAGYATNQNFTQATGEWGFSISTVSGAVGDTVSWRDNLLLDTNKVTMRYQNSTKLVTASTGVTITGIAATTDTTASASDIRLKKNVRDYKPSKLNIKWREFEWKEDNRTDFGVIADELLETHPEFVVVPEDENEMKFVKYEKVLIAKNIELEARIEKLEKLIEKLL